jgi:hypothetical protein
MTLYPERYVAFVDILGWRQLISKLNGDSDEEVIALRSALARIHDPAYSPQDGGDVRAQSISDAVAVSTEVSAIGLLRLFESLSLLSLAVLERGHLVRGAVVKGRLYHADAMVFGHALNEAYRLECQVARFPRIMIARSVAEDATTHAENPIWSDRLHCRVLQSQDGPKFLNVLKEVSEAIQASKQGPSIAAPDHPVLSLFIRMKAGLERNLAESIDEPRHFEKVHWFVKYWNAVMPRTPDFQPIKGPGFEPINMKIP